MVSREVLCVVLPLAVWIVGWLAKDLHAAPASALIVGVDITYAHHDRRLQGDIAVDLDEDQGAIAYVELSSMISHANAQSKAEGFAQSLNRVSDIRVCEFRKNRAPRHGAIG